MAAARGTVMLAGALALTCMALVQPVLSGALPSRTRGHGGAHGTQYDPSSQESASSDDGAHGTQHGPSSQESASSDDGAHGTQYDPSSQESASSDDGAHGTQYDPSSHEFASSEGRLSLAKLQEDIRVRVHECDELLQHLRALRNHFEPPRAVNEQCLAQYGTSHGVVTNSLLYEGLMLNEAAEFVAMVIPLYREEQRSLRTQHTTVASALTALHSYDQLYDRTHDKVTFMQERIHLARKRADAIVKRDSRRRSWPEKQGKNPSDHQDSYSSSADHFGAQPDSYSSSADHFGAQPPVRIEGPRKSDAPSAKSRTDPRPESRSYDDKYPFQEEDSRSTNPKSGHNTAADKSWRNRRAVNAGNIYHASTGGSGPMFANESDTGVVQSPGSNPQDFGVSNGLSPIVGGSGTPPRQPLSDLSGSGVFADLPPIASGHAESGSGPLSDSPDDSSGRPRGAPRGSDIEESSEFVDGSGLDDGHDFTGLIRDLATKHAGVRCVHLRSILRKVLPKL